MKSFCKFDKKNRMFDYLSGFYVHFLLFRSLPFPTHRSFQCYLNRFSDSLHWSVNRRNFRVRGQTCAVGLLCPSWNRLCNVQTPTSKRIRQRDSSGGDVVHDDRRWNTSLLLRTQEKFRECPNLSDSERTVGKFQKSSKECED